MKLSFITSIFLGLFSLSSLYLSAYAANPVQNKVNNVIVTSYNTANTANTAAKNMKSKSVGSAFTYLGFPVELSAGHLGLNKIVLPIGLVDSNLKPLVIGGAQDKPQVIASLVSLNTPVCAKEALDLNQLAIKNPNVNFIVVSKDLPFLLADYAKKNKIKNITFASSFRNNAFGNAYGTLIQNSVLKGLDSRAVFVINTEGELVYQQRVSEIATPPNYKTLSLAIDSIKASDIDEIS